MVRFLILTAVLWLQGALLLGTGMGIYGVPGVIAVGSAIVYSGTCWALFEYHRKRLHIRLENAPWTS